MKIYTFGEFDIIKDGESLIEKLKYQNRLLELFKYFLSHESQKVPIETLIEEFWSERDYIDPKNVLRTQISRIRKIFNENFFTIDFIDGYYLFKLRKDVCLDYKRFEEIIIDNNNNYEEINNIYKGDYLPEIGHSDWINNFRNRYRNMYLNYMKKILLDLYKKDDFYKVIHLCEIIFEKEKYEEDINLLFIESLIATGQNRQALIHYEKYTSKIYQKFGVVPSDKIKNIYKKLHNTEEKLRGMVYLDKIDRELDEKFKGGALVCDISYFKFLYNFEIRNRNRNKDRDILIGIISIDNLGYTQFKKEELNYGMDILLNILSENMRGTDVISKWNDSQLVVLLYDIKLDYAYIMGDRLKKAYNSKVNNREMTVNMKVKNITE